MSERLSFLCVSALCMCVYLPQLVAMCLGLGDNQGECECMWQCNL